MLIHTVITTANEGMHISATQVKNKFGERVYVNPVLTVYDIQDEDHRTVNSEVRFIWTDVDFIAGRLYQEVSHFCDVVRHEDYELPRDIEEALVISDTDPFELKDIIDKAKELGMFSKIAHSPFEIINMLSEG